MDTTGISKTMAALFDSFILFILLSTVSALSPTTSPGNQPQKPNDLIVVSFSNSKIHSPTDKIVNIDVGNQKSQKEPGEFSDEFTVMPASGSFPGKLANVGNKQMLKENEIPIMMTWRPVNPHFNRMRLIRHSFPVHCRHRRPTLNGGNDIHHQMDVIRSERQHHNRRYGKIISARWVDGTTFHRLDAVTIPDVGERLMFKEFKTPRIILRRNRRHIDHHKVAKGHVLWRMIRNFLINL